MGLFDRKTGRGSNTAKGKQGFQRTIPKPAQAPNGYNSAPVKISAGFAPQTAVNTRPTVDDMFTKFRQAHPEYNNPVVSVPVPTAYEEDYYDPMEELVYRCATCGETKSASEMSSMTLCRSCIG